LLRLRYVVVCCLLLLFTFTFTDVYVGYVYVTLRWLVTFIYVCGLRYVVTFTLICVVTHLVVYVYVWLLLRFGFWFPVVGYVYVVALRLVVGCYVTFVYVCCCVCCCLVCVIRLR